MNSKLLFLVFGLLALSCVLEAKKSLKKLSHKHLAFGSENADKAINHIRRRRDTEEAKASSSSEEVTDADALAIMKFFIAAGWEGNKLEFLADFLEEMADHETNLTVVGWQKIYNDQGEVTEVNTVELVIPPKPVTENDKGDDDDDDLLLDDDEDDEDDDRVLPYGKINELREIFTPFAQIGIPISVTMEEYTRKGQIEGNIYLDKDELYVFLDNFIIYNKTAHLPVEEVEKFIQKQSEAKSIFGKPTVLRYDVDGHLIPEKSFIKPELLGGVTDYFEAPDEVLYMSPEYIAEISQKYPHEEIPKQLGIKYNEKFPEYTWRVVVDPEYFFVHRDASVTVTYDNFDFDEDSDVSYLVYGVKKDA